MNKVVYVVPGGKGGVNSFYTNLQSLLNGQLFLTKNDFKISQNYFVMILRFIYFMKVNGPNVIVVNPSLFKRSIMREFFYAYIAEKCFDCEVIVFWRGWNPKNEFLLASLPRITNFFLNRKNLCLNTHVYEKLIETKTCVYRISTSYDILLDRIAFTVRNDFDLQQVLFLGRLEKEKGITELLGFAEQLKFQLQLSVAGEGSLKQKVQEHSGVKYLGYLIDNEKMNAYLTHSIFVLPSHSEGMPNAVLEAMRLGLIVIASKVGALTDLIIHGKNGFLIEPKSIDSLIDCYVNLKTMDNHQLRLISSNAISTAKRYSPFIVANQLNKFTSIC